MLRTLITDFLLPLLLFLLLRSFLQNLFGSRSRQPQRTQPQPPRPDVPAGGELRKDPVCGTYVSVLAGVREKINGEVVYFCSEACRKRYVS
jgi:YHS domain-containing protein